MKEREGGRAKREKNMREKRKVVPYVISCKEGNTTVKRRLKRAERERKKEGITSSRKEERHIKRQP